MLVHVPPLVYLVIALPFPSHGGPLDKRLSWGMHYADNIDPLFELRKQIAEHLKSADAAMY